MNFLLLIYLLLIGPKLLIERLFKGKRHPGFAQRIGLKIPQVDRPVIWLHAVSVGEVKSAKLLFQELRKREKEAFFLVTTTTATGQAEAKRSLPEADAHAYLPLDFSWVVKRWVKKLAPRHFILIESDFWPNLLSALKQRGTKISLVSGKISERSLHRFQRFRFFAKRLFAHFDHICVQNEEYHARFLPLVPDAQKLHITGNLKLELSPQTVDLPFWRHKLGVHSPILTLSCTHAPEEEELLAALQGTDWFLILAPRHPERFAAVAQLLKRKNIPFFRWSQWEKRRGGERLLLVDAMGQLPICYSLSQLAIVAGSYVSHIGGHNLLEPCLYGTPVLFGPHVFGQKELAQKLLESGAGRQVPLAQLAVTLQEFPLHAAEMREAARRLVESNRGMTARTLNALWMDD